MTDEMTDAERIERRLADLEVKSAFMDELLERLNEVLVRQQDQIDRLTAELRRWQDQADAATGPAPRNPLEDKPPHW